MNTAVAAVPALLVAAAAGLLAHAARGAHPGAGPSTGKALRLPGQLGLRTGLAAAGLAGVTAATRWPVAGAWAGALGFAIPSLLGIDQRRCREV